MRYSEINEGQVRKVEVHFRQPEVIVYINPSAAQIDTALSRTQYACLRAHLGDKLLVWDAEFATHDHVDDCGEFGKLKYIRLLIEDHKIRCMRYGYDGADFPTDPNTLEDLISHEQLVEAVQSHPLIMQAFPGYPVWA
jgi:hypothetical protein